MNLLKTGLILFFFAVFVFACSRTENSGSVVVNGNQTAANLPASAAPQISTAGDELASARRIYSETCAKCHKTDGAGGVTVIDGKNVKAPNLTSERQKREPDSEYIEIIEKGALEDGMPAYKGKISDEDIKNLVKYIRREFQGK